LPHFSKIASPAVNRVKPFVAFPSSGLCGEAGPFWGETMKAIVITGVGGPEVLEIREVPTPEPRGEQVRVRVRACGVNRADLLQCRGFYPAPAGAPPDIPGLEYAGEVDALGPDVTRGLKLGDRVFGIVGGGGQAEFVLTHERLAVLIPPGLDDVQAAAVPEAFITAFDALLAQGRIVPGERVLIHAAGSGVGTAAVQIAHTMGCTVFGTSRTGAKLDQAKRLGLDHAIDVSAADFAASVQQATEGKGVDVVIDLIGGSALAGNLAALAPMGRLVLVGLLGGTSAPLDLNLMLRKRLTIVATTLRARALEEKIAVTRRFGEQLVPWLSRGLVRPVVDSVFAFEDVRAALARMESNQVFGKVVLSL
jgi:putative PIG3 family NAD(P)H quinone oxidoreductase